MQKISEMRVGDPVMVPAEEWDEKKVTVKKGMRRGCVTYIHPQGRFFTVQFPSGVRASYHQSDLERPAQPATKPATRGNRSRKY